MKIAVKPKIEIHSGLESLSRAAAEFITRRAEQAVNSRGFFSIALSGGNTPKMLYEKLAAAPFTQRFPWRHSRFFWTDERFVAPDHPQSNFGMATQAMLEKIPVDNNHVYPVPTGAGSVKQTAGLYEKKLRQVFGNIENEYDTDYNRSFPRFDLVLLGLGADGHTASLFPGSAALEVKKRWVVPVTAPAAYSPRDRVSFTLGLINQAACVVFLASGREKSPVVKAILNEPEKAFERYPAARVSPVDGELVWFVDREAVS